MLALNFFFISLLYATVGFGGGSSYLAIMAVMEIPFEVMPKLALMCNLLVVTGGCILYWKNGHFSKRLILPFVISSVPMAFLGGMYRITESAFLSLLTVCLLLAGIRLLFLPKVFQENISMPPVGLSLAVGGILGFISGMVAIGGGIFLSPLLMNLRWGTPKQIAATASAFIWLNSVAGLIGQFTKGNPADLWPYWPLFLGVLVGGQIGSRIGTHTKVSQILIQRGTAILILFISIRLMLKII